MNKLERYIEQKGLVIMGICTGTVIATILTVGMFGAIIVAGGTGLVMPLPEDNKSKKDND
jgi:hypothetical protein